MENWNLRDLILSSDASYLQKLVNDRNWTVYFKSDRQMFKCRIIEIRFTATGVKLLVSRIVYGDNYLLSLDDYKLTWSDKFSDMYEKIKPISLFDLSVLFEEGNK